MYVLTYVFICMHSHIYVCMYACMYTGDSHSARNTQDSHIHTYIPHDTFIHACGLASTIQTHTEFDHYFSCNVPEMITIHTIHTYKHTQTERERERERV
jgi:hypothetical protein